MRQKQKDNTFSMILAFVGLLLAGMYLPGMLHAGYFDNWTAPGQTWRGPGPRQVRVSTSPEFPTIIVSTNGNRSDLWIVNKSTMGVRLYVSTSAHLFWDTTQVNQRVQDMFASSNSFPTPRAGVFQLQAYSTAPYVIVGPTATSTGNSQNVFAPNPWMNQFKGHGIDGNNYHEGAKGYQTYVGPWFAVAVGSAGPQNQGMGTAEISEEAP